MNAACYRQLLRDCSIAALASVFVRCERIYISLDVRDAKRILC